MSRRSRATVVGAGALVGSLLASCIAPDPLTADAERRARAAAERFLDRYVSDEGRVARHDQGGDTVSEGQAYALLLAAAIGDRARFELVWAWTAANLQRPDGLLAWHWADGSVADAEPAADADLVTSRALLLAGERFDELRDAPHLHRAVRGVGRRGVGGGRRHGTRPRAHADARRAAARLGPSRSGRGRAPGAAPGW
ncbi:MAG TPA: glycosyl hydrolase family 8 [Acidimicrobiia bacterium]